MAEHEAQRTLLSPDQYDDDASSVDSGAENHNDISSGADKPFSTDDDFDVLREAEEQEKLLVKPNRVADFKSAFMSKDGRQRAVKSVRRTPKAGRGSRQDEAQVMFEMEEGFKDTSSQSSFEQSNEDEKRWKVKHKEPQKSRRSILVYITIVVLCVVFATGAVGISRRSHAKVYPPNTLSNGTHFFAPTTIVISLDGFRADFLQRDLTPALNAFRASGVSPQYMLPSFPSVTFPNHFTLVTGLYPQDHGIVGNQFWDEDFQEEFYYTSTAVSMQPKWWKAEPIWSSAERQGIRTAVHMWPGSEAHIPEVDPTYLDEFNDSEALPRKVNRILDWLDLPGNDDKVGGEAKRPQLIAAYVPNVDADGHKFGPNSTEIRATIADVDSMFVMLIEGLLARNLTEIVNIVVVSDHGMATTSNDRLIQLDDLIDLSLVDHIDGWPLRGLRLKNPDRDVPILEEQLLKAAEAAGTFDVYTLATMPERYHFNQNERIAPLWVVPKTGWAVVEKHDFDVAEAKAKGETYHPKGLHGYDHEHPLMRAIFIARGPAFPHLPNSRIPNFQNTEVYNIICDSLGIQPNPNNGTLRLPLSTLGLHSDEDTPQLDIPPEALDDVEIPSLENVEADTPNKDSHTNVPPVDVPPESLAVAPISSDVPEETTLTSAAPTEVHPSSLPDSQPDSDTRPQDSKSSWWSFLHDQLQKAKDWAIELVESIKGNKSPEG